MVFLTIFCSTFTLLIFNLSLVYFNFSSWKAINTTLLFVLSMCIQELDHSALQATLYLPVNETSLWNFHSLSWWPQVGMAGSTVLLWPSAHVLCSVITIQPCTVCLLSAVEEGCTLVAYLCKRWSVASSKKLGKPSLNLILLGLVGCKCVTLLLLLIIRSDHHACDIILEKFYLCDGETVTLWLVAE